MCQESISQNPWFVALIAPILLAIINRVFLYYSKDERHKRKLISETRKAIVDLSERFNISVGHSSSMEYTPILDVDDYKKILFEVYLRLNKRSGAISYPNDDNFIEEANLWYAEWEHRNMADAIQFMSPYEMNSLLIEVCSYGVKGCPILYRILPHRLLKIWWSIKNIPYRLKSKNTKINDYLYKGVRLPTGRAASITLAMLTGEDETLSD